ncbi:hypothetical protein GQR58_014940 [Nymphon striatum]|nr:hypothetical protein GQR58_014940 [Nymphon striatum]
MSWFDSRGWATLAKSALSNAQKTIDQALDIKECRLFQNLFQQAVIQFQRKKKYFLSNKILQNDIEFSWQEFLIQVQKSVFENMWRDTGEAFFSSFGIGSPITDESSSELKKENITTNSEIDNSNENSWNKWSHDSEVSSALSEKQFEDESKTEEMYVSHQELSVDQFLEEQGETLDPLVISKNDISSDENLSIDSIINEDENTLPTSDISKDFIPLNDKSYEKYRNEINPNRPSKNEIVSLDNIEVNEDVPDPSGRFDYQNLEPNILEKDGNSWKDDCEISGQWEVELDLTNSTLSLINSEKESEILLYQCSSQSVFDVVENTADQKQLKMSEVEVSDEKIDLGVEKEGH